MRILFIVPKLSGGGAERIAAGLASSLAERHRVTLVSLFPSPGVEYPLSPRVKCVTITPSFLRLMLPFPWMRRNLRSARFRALRMLRRLLRVTHCVSFLESANVANAASRGQGKTVLSARNLYSRKYAAPENALALAEAAAAARQCDALVALSRVVAADQAALTGLPEARIHVIYNACDGDAVRRLSEEPLSGADGALFASAPIFVTAGRLIPQKGQWHLIRAFRSVLRELPEARLLILGEGPLKDGLVRLVSDLGLSGRVFLCGHRENPFPLIAGADAFVFPSLYEGFGNVLTEAMALGVPVIACDCPGGPREILSPDSDPFRPAEAVEAAPYGLLCPPLSGDLSLLTDPQKNAAPCGADENMLAEAMVRLIGDGRLRARLSAAGRARAAEFSPEKIAKEWETLLRSL